jgi:hypothetical protein
MLNIYSYIKKHAFIIGILSTVITISVIIFLYLSSSTDESDNVLSVSITDNVQISAEVAPQEIEFIVYPEKRVPPTNNWNTIVDFEIYECSTSTLVTEYKSVTTNFQGEGTIDISSDTYDPNKSYQFSIEGISHLRKKYSLCEDFNTAGTFLDFSSEPALLAGDTSVVKDNYINALDLSNISRNIYTNDYRNDLNQDSKVNALDLSNLIFNFYKNGD